MAKTVKGTFPSFRKAARAAVVLLPLLGITNVLFMIEAPLDDVRKFAVWSYSTHFLRSFQGLFVAIFYCFFNGEVRADSARFQFALPSLSDVDKFERSSVTKNGWFFCFSISPPPLFHLPLSHLRTLSLKGSLERD